MSALTGETEDISHLRYKFWEPIWIYDPKVKFGDIDCMLEGRYLGIAESTGNVFTYNVKISSMKDTKVIQRSVITARAPKEKYFGSVLSPEDRSRAYLFPKSLCENHLEKGDDSETEENISFDEPLFPRSYKPVASKLTTSKVARNSSQSTDSTHSPVGSRGNKGTSI